VVNQKILLIGYDGISPSKLKRYIQSGETPTFAKITKEGTSGTLTTTIPPISAPAWSSINTGLSPGNHGVFDFITRDYENPENDNKIHDSRSLRGKTLWDILSKIGTKSIVINVPLTYPPYPINGILISGFPSPKNKLVASPKTLEKRLRKEYPEYKIDIDIPSQDYNKIEKKSFLDEAFKIMEEKTRLALELLTTHEWDLFYIVYTITDRVQHMFWAYDEDPENKWNNHYSGEIKKLYKTIDNITEKYLDTIDNETSVIILSDHGFETIHTRFNILNWMRREKLVEKSKQQSKKFQTIKRIYKKIGSSGLIDTTKLFNSLPMFFKKTIINEKINHIPGGFFFDQIDLRREDIEKEKILAIRDTATGSKIVDKVYFKDEIYHGKYAKNAVDLLIVPESGYSVSTQTDKILEKIPYPYSNHISEKCRKGIFYAYGPRIKKDAINLNGIDITPTVIWAITGEDPLLEGKVRREIFL
jgi:predicted AlkP superfamily phosphohydrolase/phosphomutase